MGPSLRTILCKLVRTTVVSLWWAILALSASGVGLQSCPDRFPDGICIIARSIAFPTLPTFSVELTTYL